MPNAVAHSRGVVFVPVVPVVDLPWGAIDLLDNVPSNLGMSNVATSDRAQVRDTRVPAENSVADPMMTADVLPIVMAADPVDLVVPVDVQVVGLVVLADDPAVAPAAQVGIKAVRVAMAVVVHLVDVPAVDPGAQDGPAVIDHHAMTGKSLQILNAYPLTC